MKKVITNITQMVTPRARLYAAGEDMNSLEIRENVMICMEEGLITEILPGDTPPPPGYEIIDGEGQIVLPAFSDPHTHIPFGGSRAGEFNMRLKGKDYMDIARAGGGINSTVRATREAGEDELYVSGMKNLSLLARHGVATVEMKSGYGLDLENELKQLRVIKRLKENSPLDIRATFMGAHEIPPEYREDKEAYIRLVIEEMLPAVKEQGIAEYCDVFCEEGIFDIEETRRIIGAARKLGFKIRLHADEIVPLGGAELAAESGALSADHLMQISEQGIRDMVAAGTVFTLLPGTTFFLMSHRYAPAKRIIEAGGILSLSTDLNPGSSHTHSMPLIINLACLKMGMTIEQAINAVTLNGAYALELSELTGSIHRGKQADLLFLDAPDYEYLVYNFGVNRISGLMKKGEWVFKEKRQNISPCC